MRDALIRWGDLKAHMAKGLEISQAMLHIHIGLALFLIAGRLLGRRPGSFAPLLLVTALELANEALDLIRYRTSGWPWTPWGTIGDVVNTLFWPLVLTIIARRRIKADGTA